MITGAQIRTARAALTWTIEELAEKSGIAPNTVRRVERDGSIHQNDLRAIEYALKDAGVAFIDVGGRRTVVAPG
ncbi:MAG: helix-turn-helix domain-containing protein [Alphaproteobacteria bacterium]|nr:helix-turn-helix domain-containing protein [Alphaproteobacteria bacterium]